MEILKMQMFQKIKNVSCLKLFTEQKPGNNEKQYFNNSKILYLDL